MQQRQAAFECSARVVWLHALEEHLTTRIAGGQGEASLFGLRHGVASRRNRKRLLINAKNEAILNRLPGDFRLINIMRLGTA
jgi:hypothetical protein